MASQTLSAPAHNMFAEKTLGIAADFHFRHAHNVKIGFVDAKVKSNKTLPWLCSKPHNEQEEIY